ncbi:MAG TPA: sigma-70 family RNA polymerase sigma factor [Phycisphaerae bacterium]|nr:sigma-70 family RNA polymerase sigma factor [Phycisphaerae bacterium]
MTDADALHLYATHADAAALAHLVAAHADLIYAAALRQVIDPGLAEDVAQAVFILLSRRAARIRPQHLAGWLVRAAHFGSKDALKRRRRRQHHEERAMTLRPELIEPQDAALHAQEWLDLRPHLDAALARLRPVDRTAIALRYIENRSISDVAAAMHITEPAAAKRIQRALGRLRKRLARYAPSATALSLAALLTKHASATAPATLLTTPPSSLATAIANNTAHLLKLAKLKGATFTTVAATVAATLAAASLPRGQPAVRLAARPPARSLTTQHLVPTLSGPSPLVPAATAAADIAQAPEPDPTPSLDKAIRAVARQEHTLTNLRVTAESFDQQWNERTTSWEPAGEAHLIAIYQNPGDQCRIECDKRLLPWEQGSEPFILTRYSRAFDGQITSTLTTETGPAAHPREVHDLQTFPGRSPDLNLDARTTAWSFSIFGARKALHLASSPSDQAFSDFLAAISTRPGFRTAVIGPPGAPLLEVATDEDSQASIPIRSKWVYVLDPQHAYAICEFKYYSFGPISQPLPPEEESPSRLAQAWQVTDFLQPLPGLFYPRTVASQQFSLRINQPPLLIHRSQTTITSSACNLPAPAPDIFHADMPAPILTSPSP